MKFNKNKWLRPKIIVPKKREKRGVRFNWSLFYIGKIHTLLSISFSLKEENYFKYTPHLIFILFEKGLISELEKNKKGEEK